MQVGLPVLVLESSPDERKEGSAIALWTNAFRALDALGVAEPLRAAHPLLTRSIVNSLPKHGQSFLGN